jgi:hypothetical protein
VDEGVRVAAAAPEGPAKVFYAREDERLTVECANYEGRSHLRFELAPAP